ncbi:MAG: GLPGLI family protein [Prevotellaceae bacterium]|nr:GLPGLI family protein [Prevotella sp.]MDD7257790.1 GLPGLI family protein [Prevotellaceae bacterium]MDY6131677.1 GLPGLI family protein [Prevotella sp.]
MKKTLLMMAGWIAGAITVNAQITIFRQDDLQNRDSCDKMKYVVNYDMDFVENTEQVPYEYTHDRMLLQIGEKATAFFSYDTYLADSTNLEVMKRNGTDFVGGGGVSWRLYKNYPQEKHYTYMDKLGSERYACTEKVEEPVWQLVTDSATTIKEHPCLLATADYRGRKWYAWYAEDIPVSEGPWKLCGLPGLVLRAYDAENQYRFELSGIRNARPNENIVYVGKKYEDIDKKSLNKQYERYYGDPLGFISGNPNVKVTVTDQHGNKLNKMSAIPYNPIER